MHAGRLYDKGGGGWTQVDAVSKSLAQFTEIPIVSRREVMYMLQRPCAGVNQIPYITNVCVSRYIDRGYCLAGVQDHSPNISSDSCAYFDTHPNVLHTENLVFVTGHTPGELGVVGRDLQSEDGYEMLVTLLNKALNTSSKALGRAFSFTHLFKNENLTLKVFCFCPPVCHVLLLITHVCQHRPYSM